MKFCFLTNDILQDYLNDVKKNEKEFLTKKSQDDELEQLEKERVSEDKNNVLIPRTSIPVFLKKNLNKT